MNEFYYAYLRENLLFNKFNWNPYHVIKGNNYFLVENGIIHEISYWNSNELVRCKLFDYE